MLVITLVTQDKDVDRPGTRLLAIELLAGDR